MSERAARSLVGIVPALAQLVGLFFVGETPPWLLRQGNERQAVAVLEKLRVGSSWRDQLVHMKVNTLDGWEMGAHLDDPLRVLA